MSNVNLYHLNEHLSREEKLDILTSYIDAEYAMFTDEGDDHPAVDNHRALVSLVISEEDYDEFFAKLNELMEKFYDGEEDIQEGTTLSDYCLGNLKEFFE